MRVLLAFLCTIVLCASGARADDAWKGVVQLPGVELEFSVVFAPGAGDASGWTATMSIPLQGLKDGPLQDVRYDDAGAHFVLPVPGAPAEFDVTFLPSEGADAPARASGTMKQAGQTFPITLERVADVADLAPKRPQTPRPPFPYATTDVTIENPEAPGVTLGATLVLPDVPGRVPAVVMITGSGPQDRDETIFDHKPFFVIADHLARRGIASLRYDDRGTAQSTGDFGEANVFDFASDARAAMSWLARHERIDKRRIGLMGHSEGGIVAPVVATQHDDVAFLILLAPTGVTGDQVLVAQTTWLLEQGGATPDQVARRREAFQRVMDKVKQGADARALVPDMKTVLQIDAEVAGTDPGLLTDEDVLAVTDRLAGRWMREFVRFNPYETLVRISQPTLVLLCELDRQVFPSQNAEPIREALTKAPVTDFQVRILPGLNHLFQHATTGALDEYPKIEETFSPEALDIIANWITNRFPQGR